MHRFLSLEYLKKGFIAFGCLGMAMLLGPFTAIPVLFMMPSLARLAQNKEFPQPELAVPCTNSDGEC